MEFGIALHKLGIRSLTQVTNSLISSAPIKACTVSCRDPGNPVEKRRYEDTPVDEIPNPGEKKSFRKPANPL